VQHLGKDEIEGLPKGSLVGERLRGRLEEVFIIEDPALDEKGQFLVRRPGYKNEVFRMAYPVPGDMSLFEGDDMVILVNYFIKAIRKANAITTSGSLFIGL